MRHNDDYEYDDDQPKEAGCLHIIMAFVVIIVFSFVMVKCSKSILNPHGPAFDYEYGL